MANIRSLLKLFILASACLFFPAVSRSQALTNGYTFTRQQGLSTSSSASSVVLAGSRVLGQSCRDQVQNWYRQQGIANWADQGCITEPENVRALPLVPGQLEQFEILDKTRKFGVADQTVSSISESTTHQKAVTSFAGYGLSVFIQPQY
jgi:hypothetical protein